MATVQGGWAAKNGRTWLRRSLLRNTTAPEASAPWTWKMLFARSKPMVLDRPAATGCAQPNLARLPGAIRPAPDHAAAPRLWGLEQGPQHDLGRPTDRGR